MGVIDRYNGIEKSIRNAECYEDMVGVQKGIKELQTEYGFNDTDDIARLNTMYGDKLSHMVSYCE